MTVYYYGYNSVKTDGSVLQALADQDGIYVAKNATVGSTTNDAFTAAYNLRFSIDGGVFSGNGYAIRSVGALRLVIGLEGSIGGYNAVYGTGSTNTISNAGSIATFYDAVDLYGDGSSITNSGVITSVNGYGLSLNGSDTHISNSGTIGASNVTAVQMTGGTGVLQNSGVIHSTDDTVRLVAPDGSTSHIINTGSIESAGQIAISAYGATLIDNSGKIVGDVVMNEGDDRYDGHAGQVLGTVFGGTGADTLIGGDAVNDVLAGGAGADFINGGGGSDTASYADATAGLTVDLIYATANTGDAAGDVFNSIENLAGSDYADVLLGTTGANTLSGAAGADQLIGRQGDDVLDGGAGDDILDGGDGNDLFRGGDGIDTASFADAKKGVTVSLMLQVQDTGSGVDTFSSIESLTGSAYNDRLTGDGGANTLAGNNGDDLLNGGAGNDTLYGGKGKDVFVFSTALDAATNVDVIQGFLAADDTIQLSRAIFSTILTTGPLAASAFHLGATASDADDRILYDKTSGALFYDFDGSGAGAAVQFATLQGHPTITAADFTVIA